MAGKTTKRKKEATKIAQSIIIGRKKLRKLKTAIEAKPFANEPRAVKAFDLANKIKAQKKQIEDLGFEPTDVIKFEMARIALSRKANQIGPKSKKSAFGVGMYAIGGKIKSWR
jgi:hypothetical protein